MLTEIMEGLMLNPFAPFLIIGGCFITAYAVISLIFLLGGI